MSSDARQTYDDFYRGTSLPAPCPDTRHPSEAKLIGRSSGLQVFTLYVPPPPTTTRAGVTESA
ncbi:hypothetical protein [Dactylosporangium sp. NPDC050588]|uniref:hypothetical protein n=1 Tax=Dactylosporangium sp. NPDC050588 TaxID=3157211 RepID=UPI0033F9D230